MIGPSPRSAVDEHLAAADLRWPDDRQARAEADRLGQGAVAGDHEAAAAQLGKPAHEAARKLLDQGLTEGAVQHRPEAFTPDQRVTRDRVIAERPALHPFLKTPSIDLVDVKAHREQSADERAHAHADDAIDRDPRRAQLIEHADM